MLLFEQRASTILYNFLVANHFSGKFLLPANICPIVPLTFHKARVTVEFVDISPGTLAIDEESVTGILNKRILEFDGLLFVHTYGDPAPYSDFFSYLKEKYPALAIIDDRCLCMPEFSEPDFDLADLTLYSTGYSKMIDAGVGGFGFVHPKRQYHSHRLKFERNDLTQLEADYKSAIAHRTPFKYRDSHWLDTHILNDPEGLISAINTRKDEVIAHKNQLNAIYSGGLPSSIQLDPRFQMWRFSILVPQKEKLLETLFNQGSFASSHYASLGGIFGEGSFPQAERLHSSVVNLFNDHHYSLEQANRTVEIINRHLDRIKRKNNVQN